MRTDGMTVQEVLAAMTIEEKLTLLTGAASMATAGVERLGIPGKTMADGPHGVRLREMDRHRCVQFPNLCSLAATWDVEAAREMGAALARECLAYEIDMLLAPGINIKRNLLCGRNFEYLSEDPVLAGELAAGYIRGLQDNGVAACLKHFAMNNQETNRTEINAEPDERTMREIYLKGFEIAVKKAAPVSVMSSYNKVDALWTSENPQLLTEILRDEWGYEGFVISDWGAVHNITNSIKAGLELEMPHNPNTVEILRKSYERGELTREEIDRAASRVLRFLLMPRTVYGKEAYDRDRQHETARRLAAEGIVLLKNDGNVLPLNQYRRIAVVGEFAKKPNISGQGSAELMVAPEHMDSPLEELRKALPDTEVKYFEAYQTGAYSERRLWPDLAEVERFAADCEVVVYFAGTMISEDTEFMDRRTARMNPNYEMFIRHLAGKGKKVVVVLQSGSALFMEEWKQPVSAIVQMWLAGEGAGGAIADVLSGRVNPGGKLPETFPVRMRPDMPDVTRTLTDTYPERLEVGYRYYDRHPKEISFPFGHGLSYTSFAYRDLDIEAEEKGVTVSLKVENTGEVAGKEVVQLYIGLRDSVVSRPEKELKAFQKIELMPGESKTVLFALSKEELAYYNVSLHRPIAEGGIYKVLVGSSSRDIRLNGSFCAKWKEPYSVKRQQEDMIG